MANTHPNSIFRWEDAASLEHACWQCPTKANSPRALQTCYGVHSMPCTSYHPTMHAVGAAHRCSGCVNTKEMHEARHREIAGLVAEYKSLESPEPETPSRTPLLERNVNIAGAPRLERNAIQNHRAGVYEDPFEIRADGEIDGDEVEDDSTSLSSYTPSSTGTFATPTKKPTKAEVRAQKKAKKSAKSQTKALKNQNRNLALITTADVKRVAQVLHGDEADIIHDGSAHPLVTDRTIEDVINRNLNFVKNIQVHKQYLFRSVAAGRKENKERKRLKKRESQGETLEDRVEMEEVVSAIMIQLGVSACIVSASSGSGTNSGSMSAPFRTNSAIAPGRKRASSALTVSPSPSAFSNKPVMAIAAKLRAAIKTDLEKHENEVHARYVRAGGFWRYVGKTVFERMTEIAAELDVGSGERWEKKRAREGRTRNGSDDAEAEGVAGEDEQM